MNNKQPSISIGIPTYESGKSLVFAIKSLYNQTAYGAIKEIIVAVDGKKIADSIHKQIANPKLKVVVFPKRKGQSARINDLCRLASTDYLLLTNDDIIVKKDAVEIIIKKLSRQHVDLLGCQVDALSNKSLLEKMINTGRDINMSIADLWNKGNNFLHCNGRLIVLSKNLYKKIVIPELLWNNDAYIFLFNSLQKGSFVYLPEAIGYYQTPQTLAEHLKQSIKFQLSLKENQQYFKNNLQRFYTTPKSSVRKAFIQHIVSTPLLTSGYLVVYFITRFMKIINKPELPKRGFWETDKTTKQISFTSIIL